MRSNPTWQYLVIAFEMASATAPAPASDGTAAAPVSKTVLLPGAPVGVEPKHVQLKDLPWMAVDKKKLARWKKMYTAPTVSGGDASSTARAELPMGVKMLYDPNHVNKEGKKVFAMHEAVMKTYSAATYADGTPMPSFLALALHYYVAIHFTDDGDGQLVARGAKKDKFVAEVLFISHQNYEKGDFSKVYRVPSLFAVGVSSFSSMSAQGNCVNTKVHTWDALIPKEAKRVARLEGRIYSFDEAVDYCVDWRLLAQNEAVRVFTKAYTAAIYMYPQFFKGLAFSADVRNAMKKATDAVLSKAKRLKRSQYGKLCMKREQCIEPRPDDEGDDDAPDVIREGKKEAYMQYSAAIDKIEQERAEYRSGPNIARACIAACMSPEMQAKLSGAMFCPLQPPSAWATRIKEGDTAEYTERMRNNPGTITHSLSFKTQATDLETTPLEERQAAAERNRQLTGEYFYYTKEECGDAYAFFNDSGPGGNLTLPAWQKGEKVADCACKPKPLPIFAQTKDKATGKITYSKSPLFNHKFVWTYLRSNGMPHNPNDPRRVIGNGCQLVVTIRGSYSSNGAMLVAPFVTKEGSLSGQLKLARSNVDPISTNYKGLMRGVADNPDLGDDMNPAVNAAAVAAADAWGAMLTGDIPGMPSAGMSTDGDERKASDYDVVPTYGGYALSSGDQTASSTSFNAPASSMASKIQKAMQKAAAPSPAKFTAKSVSDQLEAILEDQKAADEAAQPSSPTKRAREGDEGEEEQKGANGNASGDDSGDEGDVSMATPQKKTKKTRSTTRTSRRASKRPRTASTA